MIKVDNAIIMAAGTSSRFAPLSFEKHKALISVKGEVLIERQIKQLKEAGIDEIIIVTGYLHEQFAYLVKKFGVTLVHNFEYTTRNNHSSIYAVRKYLKNSYLCSADNYFTKNPFTSEVDDSYYAAIYTDQPTQEWCLQTDENGYINHVQIGGENAWYMLGHTFWSQSFSQEFLQLLTEIYPLEETKPLLWEAIYMRHLNLLKMKMKKYPNDFIFEFDTLDELRVFDTHYQTNSGSTILKEICEILSCKEYELSHFKAIKAFDTSASGFTFEFQGKQYQYDYQTKKLLKCQ